MDENLDAIAQEIWVYKKGRGSSFTRASQLISLRLGYYCKEHNIAFNLCKEYLAKIFEYVNSLDEAITVKTYNIFDIREKILDIVGAESDNQIFYRETLSKEGQLLAVKEKEDIKLLLYMLNMTIYCVTLVNEKVKDIKEIKEFNI